MPTHWIVFSEKFNQPNLIPKKFIFPWISPTVNAYKASIAIRIMSDTRDEEQEQRWRERQDRGVLQDTQDLTVTYIIPVIYLIV